VFVIFGFQRKPHRLATVHGICAGCHERGAQDVCSVRTRFRLFFVPVVPWPTRYRTTCTSCGTSSTVSAEKADLLLASVPYVDAPASTDVVVAGGTVAA
jgi:zinc-ribbon family